MQSFNNRNRQFCELCGVSSNNDYEHRDSDNHRFNFRVHEFNVYRKALLKVNHNVEFKVEPCIVDNLHLVSQQFEESRGKLSIRVSSEQLQLHDKSIAFQCCVRNNRDVNIYLTYVDLLHPSANFQITHDARYKFGKESDVVLELLPNASYNFTITFSIDQLIIGELNVPLICSFQMADDERYSIPRELEVMIGDSIQPDVENTKSPFTSQVWKGVEKYIRPDDFSWVDEYSIPSAYSRLLKFGLDLKHIGPMTYNEESAYANIMKVLSLRAPMPSNYREFWHIVLWMDEIAQALMLRRYNMEKVTLAFKNRALILEVPGLAEKRPSILPSDLIELRVHGDHTVYQGVVRKVLEKHIEIIKVNEELLAYLMENPATEVDVRFLLSRLSFERMHEGIIAMVQHKMVPLLYPNNPIEKRFKRYELVNVEIFNKQIVNNGEQKSAVYQILNNSQMSPYIIFGPPGTGKTITIVEAILQIKKKTNKKILVCAPANSACDVLAMKLSLHCDVNELLRINSENREGSSFPAELQRYSNLDENGGFRRIPLKVVNSYRIVVSTLTQIGKYRYYRPDCIFIDEAAQASEPECAIAFGLARPGTDLVLAGDHRQLSPIVASSVANSYGLGVSLIERLMQLPAYRPYCQNYNKRMITMLKQNFRSHPLVLQISNRLFYDNLLIMMSQSAVNDPIVPIPIYPHIYQYVLKNWRHFGQALEFCSVNTEESRQGSSPSFFNQAEVMTVGKYVKTLLNLRILEETHQVKQEQIGVITSYKRQVYKIKHELKSMGFDDVDVGTTESFQGREKRIIIISTVRAKSSLLLLDKKYNLGFVKDDRRFNVAMTRAISKLIVVGSQPVLCTDPKWMEYIKLCINFNTYFGAPFVERTPEWKKNVVSRLSNFNKNDQKSN